MFIVIFMYIDESGKNMITQTNIDTYFIGGLNIESEQVFEALNTFKDKYQKVREKLKKQYRQNTNESERAKRIKDTFYNFELHAVEMFNPTRDKKRKKLYRENPWKYSNMQEIIQFSNELLSAIKPYIKNVYIYKTDKPEILKYCSENGIKATDTLLDDYMVNFVVNSFNDILISTDKKGTILPDNLDSRIRDQFVSEIGNTSSRNLWSEPVVIDSASNAFTQIIDIITYCYYLVYTGKCDTKEELKPVKTAYKKHIKSFIIEKDLIEYLNLKKTLTKS